MKLYLRRLPHFMNVKRQKGFRERELKTVGNNHFYRFITTEIGDSDSRA